MINTLLNTNLHSSFTFPRRRTHPLCHWLVPILIIVYIYIYRLSRGQLDAALRHTFLGRGSDQLSNEFEEFFLHNADEITELIKRSQRSSNSTHLYSQQMVCGLVQVSSARVDNKLYIPVFLMYVICTSPT